MAFNHFGGYLFSNMCLVVRCPHVLVDVALQLHWGMQAQSEKRGSQEWSWANYSQAAPSSGDQKTYFNSAMASKICLHFSKHSGDTLILPYQLNFMSKKKKA